MVGPLESGLKDSDSYVRMVAACGVLKLYHISASTHVDADFPAMLKHLMLNDPDTQVVANCLSSLQEIWSKQVPLRKHLGREGQYAFIEGSDHHSDMNSQLVHLVHGCLPTKYTRFWWYGWYFVISDAAIISNYLLRPLLIEIYWFKIGLLEKKYPS